MPSYQVELSDGRRFKVEADGPPSETDIYDFIGQQPTAETPGYLSQLGSALSTGWDQAMTGAAATFNALTGDEADLAANLASLGRSQVETLANQTPEDARFNAALATADEKWKQGGYLDAITDIGGAVIDEPGAAFKTAVQSAPNAIIGLGGQLAGRGLGALAGGVVGSPSGPGAIVTGAGGYVAGGVLANSLLEAGPAMFEALNERTGGRAAQMSDEEIKGLLESDPTIVTDGLLKGAKRGTVIGLIESLGLYGAGRIASVPERTAAAAARNVLLREGVDVASREALEAALADPAKRALVQAASESAKGAFSTAGDVARLGGAAALETGAAGLGEAGAQLVTEGQITPSEVAMEMAGEVGLSPVGATIGKGLEVGANALPRSPAVPQGTPMDESVRDFVPPPPEQVQQEVDTSMDEMRKAEEVLRKAQDEGRQEDITAAQQEAQRTAAEAKAAQERQRQYNEIRRTQSKRQVVDTATAAMDTAAEVAPLAPATAETLAAIAEQTAIETLATQTDYATQTQPIQESSQPEYPNGDEGGQTPETGSGDSLVSATANQGGQEVTDETQTISEIPLNPELAVAKSPRTAIVGQGPTIQPEPAGAVGQPSPIPPGTRVIFQQEGQQREGVVERISSDGRSAFVQEPGVKGLTSVRVPNLTAIQQTDETQSPANSGVRQVQPEAAEPDTRTDTLDQGPTIQPEPADTVGQPSAFSDYLRSATDPTRWSESDYAAAQQFADTGDFEVVRGLPKAKRNAIVREFISYSPEAQKKQDREDAKRQRQFAERNKERRRDALTLEEQLKLINAEVEGSIGEMQELPEDIQSVSIGDRRYIDVAYMAAVEAGDMEAAQRMVDQAAKEAGYSVEGWHGRPGDVESDATNPNVFEASDWGYSGPGIYFTQSKEIASSNKYSGGGGSAQKLYLKLRKPFGAGVLSQAEADTINRVLRDRGSKNPPAGVGMTHKKLFSKLGGMVEENLQDIISPAGFDGVYIKGDTLGDEMEGVVYSPEQIKSADPITRDDQGNVIPLSQRFNPQSDDIRYSEGSTDTPFQGEPEQVLRDRLGLTKFENITFGKYRTRGNLSLKGFVRRNSSRIYLNMPNIENADDLVDVFNEEATHLVYEDPAVQTQWARVKELVPEEQLNALRAEFEDRGYAPEVWDEESYNQIVRRAGLNELQKNAFRRFWEALKAAVGRIFGATDANELNRLSGQILRYALQHQQDLTAETVMDVSRESAAPFRMSMDERTFRDAMERRQTSPNLPGTPAAQASEAEKSSTQARFQPPNEADQQFVARPFVEAFTEADIYLNSVPLDTAVRAAQTGVGLPPGMDPGSDSYEALLGALIERLTAVTDATEDEFAQARIIQLTQDVARLRTQQGTQTARALGARAQVNARLLPIAPILAARQILIEKVTRVVDQRFTTDPTEKVRDLAAQGGKEGGETLARTLDEDTATEELTAEDETKLTTAERQAQRLIYRTEERLRQGSKDLKTNKDGDSINRAFREQVTDPMEQQAFRDRLKALNVGEAVADRLFLTASREAADQAAMAIYRAARALRRKTDNLLAKDSPTLVRLLNDLRKKMFPGMKWGDILTDLPAQQDERQNAIYDRIRQHELLRNLTPDEQVQLTNELDKAWQRERRKVFLRELKKEGIGAKAQVDVERIKAALPRLLRHINLGVFNSEAFREAIAPEYGFKTMSPAEVAELRKLAEAAWQQPEGILRNRALQKLLNRMQTITGVSRLEMFESYWIASVLSGLRTQFDTWMATLNGFATVSRLALAKPKAAPAILSEWLKGIGEGARESLQILAKGDYSVLKRFNEDMLKALEGEKAMRPTPISERMLKEGNWWQKFPAAVMVFVSRSMAAADHVNNTATTRGAIAAAKALNPQLYKDALTPTEAEQKSAREQAIREVTGGVAPSTREERALVSVRTREILYAAIPGEAAAQGSDIGNIAAYQNDPTGLFGGIYQAINWAFGSLERTAGKVAENEEVDKFTRALAAVAAISARSVLGVRFARFGMNFASNSTSFIPGTYFARKVLYGRELSRTRESLIFVNNLIGLGAMLALYSAFSALGDEEDDYGLEGRWDGLTPEKKRELMSAGKMPLTYWWRSKDGTVNRISYRQWEVGSIFAAVGSMLDKKKYRPSDWKKESVASHALAATGAGMAHVRDLSALAALSEILGKSAYSIDAGEEIGKKINKVSANWVTAFLPNAFRDADAWNDPQHYKAESNMDAWLRGVPVLRRQVAGGRPMLTLLGDPVELDRSPWSRVYTNAAQDEGYQVLGSLLARGIWVPVPSTERIVRNKAGDKVRISDLGGDAEWKYQKTVGKAYREYLKENGADLKALSVDEAEKQLEKDTARIRDEAARELEDSL